MSVQRRFFRFLDNITLDTARVGRIQSAARRLQTFCQTDPGISQYSPSLYYQGSFASGTAVKPVDQGREYDADIVVLMSLPIADTGRILDWFANRLRQDADYLVRLLPQKDKCIRLNYARDFHVDVVPAHRPTTSSNLIQIPSRRSGWLWSHPQGYTTWCRSQDGRTSSDFSRCVKMMKRWRDFTTGARTAVSSIVFTTLLGDHVPASYVVLPDGLLVTRTLTALSAYLEARPTRPFIRNPSLPSEDLASAWSQEDYALFSRHIDRARNLAGRAYTVSSEFEAARLWQRMFGDAFPLTA